MSWIVGHEFWSWVLGHGSWISAVSAIVLDYQFQIGRILPIGEGPSVRVSQRADPVQFLDKLLYIVYGPSKIKSKVAYLEAPI